MALVIGSAPLSHRSTHPMKFINTSGISFLSLLPTVCPTNPHVKEARAAPNILDIMPPMVVCPQEHRGSTQVHPGLATSTSAACIFTSSFFLESSAMAFRYRAPSWKLCAQDYAALTRPPAPGLFRVWQGHLGGLGGQGPFFMFLLAC